MKAEVFRIAARASRASATAVLFAFSAQACSSVIVPSTEPEPEELLVVRLHPLRRDFEQIDRKWEFR